YNQGNKVWNKYPSAMIQKVAETFVLKRAFGINGLVTKEELQTEDVKIETTPDKTNVHVKDLATMEQRKLIYDLAKEKQFDNKQMSDYIKTIYDKDSSKELTKKEASDLIEFLEGIKKYDENDAVEADYEVVDEDEDMLEGTPFEN